MHIKGLQGLVLQKDLAELLERCCLHRCIAVTAHRMTVKFVLLVNKQGQTRLAKYTDQSLTVEERRALEGEIVRKCLARSEKQVRQA